MVRVRDGGSHTDGVDGRLRTTTFVWRRNRGQVVDDIAPVVPDAQQIRDEGEGLRPLYVSEFSRSCVVHILNE